MSVRQFGLRIALLIIVAVSAVACTSDPAVRKQQHFERGKSYFDKGQYTEAVIEYRNATEIDGTFGEARKQLAESYTRVGNDRAAFDQFVRAADLLPSDVALQVHVGTLLLVARKPEEALARADAALKREPENVQALILRGNALAGLSSYEDALKSIEQAIQLDPERGATYTHLGQIELAQGSREQAESAFVKAVALDPKEILSRLALANFYWSVGRTTEAGAAFEEALKIEPANLIANRFLASFKFSTGRQAEAEPYLRQIADSSKGPEGTLALADYLMVMGRPKDAIASIEGLQSGKGLPQATIRLARAYAAAGDREKAHSLVEQMLTANNKDAAAHLLKGQLLLQEGRRDDAFASMQTASALAPASADAQYALGRIYANRGDRAAAETAFREVLRLNPRAAAAQVQLAQLQTQTNPSDSLRTAQDVARQNPDDLAARLTLVRSAIAANDLARAEQEMTKLRAEYPNVAAVAAQDATLAILKKEVARARTSLALAEKLDPAAIGTVRVGIAFEMMQNNPAGARARLEERIKQGTTPELLMLAALTYISLKDSAAAEKSLRATIDADPARNDPYSMLAGIYVSQGRLDEALTQFDTLAKKQAKPIGPLTMSGMILERQGKLDDAIKRYEDVLTIDSRSAIAANNLAWILANRDQDLIRALQLAQTAVAARPGDPQVLDTLGWVHYKRNQPEQAIPFFRQSTEKSPTVASYHYHLGLALLKNGDKANGRASLQRALALKPDESLAAEIRKALEGAN
jgi:tetratricopeptide (TPR) repeat protein